MDNCVAALRDKLNIEVDGYATGSASCDGGTCSAEGEAGLSVGNCSAGPSQQAGTTGLLGMLALGGWLFWRHRQA